tara:strand:- start:4558 stop:5343 length:786 start_codon:yes stop_codon:yes gene_type:complete
MSTYVKDSPLFLEEALASIKNQTLKASQIVIIKDGKLNDQLEKVINSFNELPIEAYLYNGDGNLGGALNYGLKYINNSLVFRMDSDDISKKDRFEVMIREFRKRHCDVLGCYIEEFCSDPKDLGQIRKVPELVTEKNLQLRNQVNHVSVLFNKNSVIACGGYEACEYLEDWYLWLRMVKSNKKIFNIPETLVYVRVGNGFIERRSGINYALKLMNGFLKFRKNNLISSISFISLLFTSVLPRLLPNIILNFIYKRFARNKK